MAVKVVTPLLLLKHGVAISRIAIGLSDTEGMLGFTSSQDSNSGIDLYTSELLASKDHKFTVSGIQTQIIFIATTTFTLTKI